jgi:chaperonin GroES
MTTDYAVESEYIGDQEEVTYDITQAIGQQNLTDFFEDSKLDEIGMKCVREFEIDESNFKTRKEKIEELYKLALQVAEVKNYPFEGASNIKYPLLTKAAIGFAALAYPAIVKDDRVVKCQVVGNDDGEAVVMDATGSPMVDPETGKEERKNAGVKAKIGERVSKFQSHQILNNMDGWEDDMDKICHIIPIIGCAFKKTYNDPVEGQNVSRLVLPQYLIMNIDARTVESANRVSELIQLYPNEIEENIRAGVFREFEYLVSNETMSDSYKDSEGNPHSKDDDKPHVFIEQHRRLDLDEDGYAEPYIVWVHKEANKVVRILARFDENDVLVNNGEVVRIKPQSYYIKFGFIPDPEGSPYDIGFGHLLQHINEAANTSINQMIDQGHRYTMGGGFIGDGLRMKSGNLRFKPGEYKRVKSGGLPIRENVVPLPMPEPSVVLMTLMQFLITAAEEFSSLSKFMAGDMPANMPATTALASIEQGMQPFKAIFKRIHRALKKEFKRLFYLNQQYLSQEEYMSVLDDEAANVQRDFQSNAVDVVPVSDPDIVNNTQALIRAQALAEFKDDPLIDGVEVRKRIFKAMNITDAEALVKIPPQTPDELVEAQKAVLQAQIADLNSQMEERAKESKRKDVEAKIKIEEAIAGIKKTMADATLSIAKAEGEEQGQQLSVYQLHLDHLNQLKETLNGSS